MSKEPKRNVYVGHRYVPKVMGEWDKTETYEGLSIVTNEGTSYTSKKRVPKGVDILNEEYWVVTGNYNVQIEEYRKDVRNLEEHFDSKSDITYVDGEIERLDQKDENITEQLAQTNTLTTHNQLDLLSRGVNALYPPEGFTACVGDGIADGGPALNALIDAFPIVVLPPAIYRTTITIQLKQRWKALVGNVDVSRNENNVATILYDGEVNNHLATVVVGNNEVDAEPSMDGS